jgi:hypothetical protein
VLVEPADPFTEAIRTGLEIGAEIVFADPDAGERPHLKDAYPDPYAIRRSAWRATSKPIASTRSRAPEEIARHAAGIAWKLQGADLTASVFVVVSLNLLDPLLDAMEEPQAQPWRARAARDVELLNPHPDSLGEICGRISAASMALRELPRGDGGPQPDRPAPCATGRASGGGEGVRSIHRRAHRPLAAPPAGPLHAQPGAGRNELCAGIFDLAVAARGVVDDNYAWDVWEAAGKYPPQSEESTLLTVRISGDEMWRDTRRIRLRRRLPSTKRRLRPFGLAAAQEGEIPRRMGQPVERNRHLLLSARGPGHGRLRPLSEKKGKSILSEERVRVEPFTTSILDGIDMRETIRKWYEHRIYVRQFQKMRGEVGAVVVIFDEDRDNRYPYMTTWPARTRTNRTWRSTRPSRSTTWSAPALAAPNTAAS